MKRIDLTDKVFSFTEEKALFSVPCHVLLGLSGGADSMALLHILSHWPRKQLQVSAVHIHHGLRIAADADERFVRAYCEKHGIPLTVIRADVSALAQAKRLSIEEAGRMVRYEQFETVRRQIGADYIVTAHTASDQVETVLMHLIRGCGTDGLCGIPVVRGCVCRPLLCCNRDEVEAYCAAHAIPYVTDESNSDIRYTRNDVRHRVLPLLRQLNPAVDEALLRLSCYAAEDCDCLNRQAEEVLTVAQCAYGYRAEALASQDVAIRHRVVRLLLKRSGVPTITQAHIVAANQAIFSGNGQISLPDGWVFAVEQGVAAVRRASLAETTSMVITASTESVAFGRHKLLITRSDAGEIVHNLFLKSTIDCDKIVGQLRLRKRTTDDYLHPAGRGVGKSLKKLMNEWHIPASYREDYPILCDDLGVVLVPGYACDERVRITDDTKHFLVCKVETVQG